MLKLAVVAFSLSGLAAGIANAETKLLTAPFGVSGINLQQGWLYHEDIGGGNHRAIDYVKSSTWKSFDVVASHDGTAVYKTGWNGGLGNFVSVKKTVSSVVWETRYAHLASSPLAAGKAVTVKRGDALGKTGTSGAANNVNHLHFVVLKDGAPVDPYDVYSDRDHYPENGGKCGENYVWTTCPPTADPPTYSATYLSQNFTDPPADPSVSTRVQGDLTPIHCQVKFTVGENQTWTRQDIRLMVVNSNGTLRTDWSTFQFGKANWLDSQSPCTYQESNDRPPGHLATFEFDLIPLSNARIGTDKVYVRVWHRTAGLLNNWPGVYFPVAVTAPPSPSAIFPVPADYDGDGKTDIAFLDKTGTGYLRVDYASNGFWPIDESYPWYGTDPTIWACPGDFNGDGYADYAQLNPVVAHGTLQVNYGPNLADGFTEQFDWYGGGGGTIPVVADFNGDGYDDYSQYEQSTGYWRLNYGPNLADGFQEMLPWYGTTSANVPAAGDLDGDGKDDYYMLERSGTGVLKINYANNGFVTGFDNLPGYGWYGASQSIIPIHGNPNGDAYDDYLQYETDTGYLRINYGWNIQNGFEYHIAGYPTGASIFPCFGDFDGDGADDLLVYNQVTGTIGIDYASTTYSGLEFFRTYFDGGVSPSSASRAVEEVVPPPTQFSFALLGNPVHAAATFSLTLPEASEVSIEIYDVSGRKITSLANGRFPAGSHTFTWHPDQPAGVYFARLVTPQRTQTHKLVLLR